MRLHFGELVLNTETRELLRGGAPVHLPPKEFELLTILLRERPRAVSKDELHEELWTGGFVEESSLPQLVSRLRKAIGDSASDAGLIRTVHGYGYAFSGEVTTEQAGESRARPTCAILWGSREIPLFEGEHIIGRAPYAALRIDSDRVSRQHAQITVTLGKAVLQDLGSKNGTFLRGERIEEPVELADGDEIGIGQTVFIFVQYRGGQSTTRLDSVER
jgi:DNA-binding winged helix-turn-helix (wHTH) protein